MIPDLGRRSICAGVGATAALGAAAALRAAATIARDWRPVAAFAAAAVGREYHDAVVAAKLERTVLARLGHGAYDGLERTAFADRLSGDLVEASGDRHFQVVAGPGAPLAVPASLALAVPDLSRRGPASPADLEQERATNHGIETVARRPGNVGLLEIGWFPPLSPELRARYAAAFSLLADTAALVIDVSGTRGGEPETVAHVASYMFDRAPFLLNSIEWRNMPPWRFRTDRSPPGPGYGERRPVLVATSARTFSGGEELAYDLQAFGRAKVIGQRTLGGANPGPLVPIGGGLMLRIPMGRAVNGRTGKNWEGAGVSPDIQAPMGGSRATALREALRVLAEPGDGPEARRALQALRELDLPPDQGSGPARRRP